MTTQPFGPPPANQDLPVPLRRKLQVLWQRVMPDIRAYGGVWRPLQDNGAGGQTPQAISLTTSWAPLTGLLETRPGNPRKMSADYTTGIVTVTEPGLYEFSMTLGIDGPLTQTLDIGARVDSVDPAVHTIRHEFLQTLGIENISFVSTVYVATGADVTFQVVVKGSAAYTLNFYYGGWWLNRIDNPSPEDAPASAGSILE